MRNPQKHTVETLINCNTSLKDTYKESAFDRECENKEELDQKVSALRYAMEQSAETHIETKPKNETDHIKSETLENMFKERQENKTRGEYEETKKITNKIRGQLKND